MHYDLIGDIHGHARPLLGVLSSLGYRRAQDVYRHPERVAIFLGDFIDSGPDSRQVLQIVRPMVEAGAALAVLGNHEFNAVLYHTPAGAAGFLRPHNPKNDRQHAATLASFAGDPGALRYYVEWFKELPVWLELPGLRVVHACWDADAIRRLRSKPTLGHLGPLTAKTLSGLDADAIKLLCKGHEVAVPGLSYADKHGQSRSELRVAWWRDATGKSCREMAVKDEMLIPDVPFPPEHQPRFPGYSATEPVLFIGHYSLEVEPAPLLPNLVCVDLGVTSGRGLAAYRWHGERIAAPQGFSVATNA